MNDVKVIQLNSEPVGKGQERVCYVHPEDPERAIKIQRGDGDKQTRRELAYYRQLSNRPAVSYAQMPRFYGKVKTNLGEGFVVDLIRNYDRQVSLPLRHYLRQGCPLSDFEPYLQVLKCYFLDNKIIFSNDMSHLNLLFQKLSPTNAQLVIIDGIGDHTYIQILNWIPFLVQQKILRRWGRFEKNIKQAARKISRDRMQRGVVIKRLQDV